MNNSHRISLSYHPRLSSLAPSPSVRSHTFARPSVTTTPLAPGDARRPAVMPWREGLALNNTAERLARVEGWLFAALVALALPAVALSQSRLWHLLVGGALERAIHAFLLPASA